MKTDFDFSTAGKKMPYGVPDGFFDDAERQARALARTSRKPSRRFGDVYLKAVPAAAACIAAVAAGVWLLRQNGAHTELGTDLPTSEYIFAETLNSMTYEEIMRNADTEELEYLAMAYADIFDEDYFDF